MTTHIGKIARLAKGRREELGRRIEDGHSGPELADWLNSLPDVQAVLQEKFGGRAISEQNLSAWRLSGHVNWLRRQEARAGVTELIGDSNVMDDESGDWSLGERLGTVLAAELNAVGMALLSGETDLDKRWERLREIHREVSRLRQDDDRARRAALQQERWDRELEREGVVLERVKRSTEESEIQSPKSKVGGYGHEHDSGGETPPELAGGDACGTVGGEAAERAVTQDESRQIKVNQIAQGQTPESQGMKAEARPAIDGNTGLESPVNSQTGKSALLQPGALEAEVARLNAGGEEDGDDGKQENDARDQGGWNGSERADWDAEDARILKEAAEAHQRREAAQKEAEEKRVAEENRRWRVEAGFEEPTDEDIALGRTKRKRWIKSEQEMA